MRSSRLFAAVALVFVSLVFMAPVAYTPLVMVAPADNLPEQVKCMDSNNNLDIIMHEGRLFFAFRTAPNHFAGTKTKLYIVSSTDLGESWDFEAEVHLGADMREPRFLAVNGKLMFYFFEAGKNPLAFAPRHIWAMERKALGDWTEKQKVFQDGCVLWRAKTREGKAYASVYCGGDQEYTGGNENITIHLLTTEDGYNFQPVNPARPVSATGGSETAFEWAGDGNLYLVVRNEAGDGESWGSKVCRADASDYSKWECAITPMKYDSPLMFERGGEIYLIARRNVDGAYDKGARWMWDPAESLYYLARYWWTPKRTALYKLDRETLAMEPLFDFPSKGDTAFPGLVKISDDSYLMFNYSSPPEGKDRVWMSGQLTGTQIYKTVLTFD